LSKAALIGGAAGRIWHTDFRAREDAMTHFRWTAFALLALTIPHAASAQAATAPHAAPAATAAPKPYVEEWVYRARYGFQDEWWRLFQKYQIAALDEEQRRGYVLSYSVFRPGAHVSEESRWDYRIVITYNGHEGSTHEGEVVKALFPDAATFRKDENRRWELTVNHWDLPIHEIDPHAPAQ